MIQQPLVIDLAGVSDPTVIPSAYVRSVIDTNIANLASFTVASRDGLTLAEGDRVLLANQTTAAECGIYVVGPVSGGSAALVRAADAAAGQPIANGRVLEVSEGTLYAGSVWKAMCTGSKVFGTDDPLFYPKTCRIVAVALVAGTKTLGSTQGLWLFSTTKSTVTVSLNTPNTVSSTVNYQAASAGRTAGKSGTAAVVVQANVAAGTINASDVSTLDVLVSNW